MGEKAGGDLDIGGTGGVGKQIQFELAGSRKGERKGGLG